MADWNREWERGGYSPPAWDRDRERWDRERMPGREGAEFGREYGRDVPRETGREGMRTGPGYGEARGWEPPRWDRDRYEPGREGEGLWDRVKRGLHVGKGPKGYQRSDERIREDACDLLERDPDVDASEIEVTVRDREVTLTGSVEDRYMKRRAEDLVERCAGVNDVHNQLRVRGREETSAHGLTGTAGGTLEPTGLAGAAGVGSLGAAPSGTSGNRTPPRPRTR